MPAEVLSYFLKHEDIRLKLRFQIVLQCAPFLKGKKVSCGITMEDSMYDELHNILSGSGISYRRLSAADTGLSLVRIPICAPHAPPISINASGRAEMTSFGVMA